MSFLEHIGNSLTSIQPWREFPPGHPRHGKQASAPAPNRRHARSKSRVSINISRVLIVIYLGFSLKVRLVSVDDASPREPR